MRLHYDRPIASSLEAFRWARVSTAEILDRLTEDEWARAGRTARAAPTASPAGSRSTPSTPSSTPPRSAARGGKAPAGLGPPACARAEAGRCPGARRAEAGSRPGGGRGSQFLPKRASIRPRSEAGPRPGGARARGRGEAGQRSGGGREDAGRSPGRGRASARPRFVRVDNRRVRSLRILVAALGGLLPAAAAAQTLTLQDAIASALAKNRDIVVERESVAQSREGIARAEAAFDPVVRGDTRYRYQKLPAISVLSGAPSGELAPTGSGISSAASFSQLFNSGALADGIHLGIPRRLQQLLHANLAGVVHLARRRAAPAAAPGPDDRSGASRGPRLARQRQ